MLVTVAALAVHTDRQQQVFQAVIIGENRAAIAITAQRLGGEETRSRRMAPGPGLAPVQRAAETLCRVGQNEQLVRLGNRVRVAVGPITAEVTAVSADRLGLAEGEDAFASFKAVGTRLVALDAGSAGDPQTFRDP